MNRINLASLSQVVEAPLHTYEKRIHQLFLAGGITNCQDWQSQAIQQIKMYPDLTIFNPRRKYFPIDKPESAKEQISWEHQRFLESTVIAVWFSAGSINPIVLYELGRWVNARPVIPAFIGVDQDYERTQDVIMQTKLDRPGIHVATSLDALILQLQNFLNVN